MSQSQDALLQVNKLCVCFANAKTPVLGGLTFDIGESEAMGLVGGSGSGKTMTARAILGVLPEGARVVGGTIHFQGQDLLAGSPADWRRVRGQGIAMVFQEPAVSLNPLLKIEDQLTEGMRYQMGLPWADARRRVRRLLVEFGIEDPDFCLSAYPHQLSGGMQQRALMAGALSCQPQLLIADEPTSALDAPLRARLLDVLVQIQQARKLSLLIITHDLQTVARRTQRMAVMQEGRIVELGPTEEVLERPRHPYTKSLLPFATNHESAGNQRTE